MNLTSLIPILVNGGTGIILGVAIGYLAKKAFKLLLIIIGLISIVLIALEYIGVIVINYTMLEALIIKIVSYLKLEAAKFVNWFTVSIPFSSGFLLGLLVGLKMS